MELRSLDDPAVIDRARANAEARRQLLVERAARPSATVPAPPAGTSDHTVSEAVLIAEIPRAGDRWNQANFDLATYEGYFGAKAGTQRRIVLRSVTGRGELAPPESRPSVEVASQNYRFELAAARHLAYPANGRPVAIFVREAARSFLYTLLLPGDSGYDQVASLLTSLWRGRADRMRRVRTDVHTLAAAWPGAPLWGVVDLDE